MLFLEIVILIYAIIIVLIGSLFLFGPFIAPLLQNVPFYRVPGDEYKAVEGQDGFFTTLQPGQVKILERGERFVECVMRWPGYTFKHLKDSSITNEAEKWEVVESDGPSQDAYPVPSVWPRQWQSWEKRWYALLPFIPIIMFWRSWQHYMYQYFGYVFTGIAPFQTVRTYPIEYFEESTSSDGAFVLQRKRNWSDHYRVAEFFYPFPLDSSDTADMIPVALAVGLTTQVVNPYMLAYFTDKAWASRYVGIARTVVNDQTRIRSVKAIVGNSGEGSTESLTQIYEDIKNGILEQIARFGLLLNDVNTPSRMTTDPEAIKRLGAAGFAAAEGQARLIEAGNEAKALRVVASAIKAHGDAGNLAAQIEGRIRTVGDAGDRAIVSIGEGSGGESANQTRMLQAILAELRKEKGGDTDV